MSADDDNGFAQWGGYMDAKVTKLEEQFAAASDPFRQSNLFAGISIYVNGLTNPSADELKRCMMVHGGTYHHYQRAHTSFVVASNLPDVKVRNMNTSRIISPQWVVDCVKANRILDYAQYLLYTNQKSTQPRLNFEPKLSANTRSNNVVLKSLQNLKSSIDETNDGKAEEVPIPRDGQKTHNTSTGKPARTAVDPKFLGEFYNNSRLHHIATLGAGFKQYVSELRAAYRPEAGFPARQALKQRLALKPASNEHSSTSRLLVMHIDMDCFFVSVGLRQHPELRGLPVAVTHSKGGGQATDVPVHPQADRAVEMELFAKRFEQHLHDNMRSDKVRSGFDKKMSLSEIACCSYEARAKGIRNGMFMGQAMKLCPDLKTIPYDFEGYRQVANMLYDTVAQYTLNIEAVSCDEMYVDLNDVLQEVPVDPMDFVAALREEVRSKTGCPCSAGVGLNKLQARMATKRAKPDGQFLLDAKDVLTYMEAVPIEELPGVGNSTAYTLEEAKLLTCGDLQQCSLARLQLLIGKKLGETLYQFCRGNDSRELAFEQVRKSVSAEVNYGIRFKEYAECETFLRQLSGEVHSRLLDIKRKTKCITLKVMVRAPEAPIETSKFMGHGVCDNVTKSISLPEYSNDVSVITNNVLKTMKSLNLAPSELRGIGIQLTKLDESTKDASKLKRENVILNMFSKVAEKQKVTKDLVENVDAAIQKKIQHVPSPVKKGQNGKRALHADTTKEKPDIIIMMQNARAKKPKFNSNNIDPDVFDALPDGIRSEILQHRTRQTMIADRAHEESVVPLKSVQVASDNVFAQPNCKELLLNWLHSGKLPEQCDTDLLCGNASEMIAARRVDEVYDGLLYLCRVMIYQRGSSEYCAWHLAYKRIVNEVQLAMRKAFPGKVLFQGAQLKCNSCSLKS